MKLKDWLIQEGLKEAKVAKDLGICMGSLSKFSAGVRRPKVDIAIAIEKYTKGQVTLYDLLWPNHETDMNELK